MPTLRNGIATEKGFDGRGLWIFEPELSPDQVAGGTMNASRSARWFAISFLALVSHTGRFANLAAQAVPEAVAPLLEKPVQSPAVTAYQLRSFMMRRAVK